MPVTRHRFGQIRLAWTRRRRCPSFFRYGKGEQRIRLRGAGIRNADKLATYVHAPDPLSHAPLTVTLELVISLIANQTISNDTASNRTVTHVRARIVAVGSRPTTRTNHRARDIFYHVDPRLLLRTT